MQGCVAALGHLHQPSLVVRTPSAQSSFPTLPPLMNSHLLTSSSPSLMSMHTTNSHSPSLKTSTLSLTPRFTRSSPSPTVNLPNHILTLKPSHPTPLVKKYSPRLQMGCPLLPPLLQPHLGRQRPERPLLEHPYLPAASRLMKLHVDTVMLSVHNALLY